MSVIPVSKSGPVTLESSFELSGLTLKNRLVMAPMTRCRALGNLPGSPMDEYYGQRTSAGLIISEGTSPSPNGLGYARIPGLFNREQVEGWKKVTDRVHLDGTKIFVQLMHTGRVSNLNNMPQGSRVVSSSALTLEEGQMWTDQNGMQPYDAPAAMTDAEVESCIGEFVTSAQLAIEAGFDGVELHGANGYLIEQFLNPTVNKRTDRWGNSIEGRNAFALAIAARMANAIGPQKVGIRLSPYGVFNAMAPYPDLEEQYVALATKLGQAKIAYVHLLDHSAQGAPPVPETIKQKIREAFGGTVILCGGYEWESANADLTEGKGHLIAIGRPFLSNPNLLSKLKAVAKGEGTFVAADPATMYSAGAEGYTSYL